MLEKIKKEFPWGTIINTHIIGEYQVIEYIDEENRTFFHPYINYKDISHAYDTLEQALIGVIAYKYEGANSHAAGYFCKMIGM